MTIEELEKIIPFDQFSRQYQVSVIIDKLRSGGEPLNLLDVGGYKGHTADFLYKDNVTVMDLYKVKESNYVHGSALEMPFDDNSFDYVLSFDVLEHIPTASRKKFFNECARVSKRGVIICAPNKTKANEKAETLLNDLHKRLHGKPHRWLKEHIDFKIPNFNSVESHAASKSFKTIRFHSNKVQLWVPMQQAIFLNSKYNIAAEQLTEINRFYNHNFKYDGGGFADSAYRSILCCLKDESEVAKLKKLEVLEHPLDPVAEIELFEKISDYYTALATKINKYANDYEDLYTHEKKRAETLQSNGEELWQRINQLEAELEKINDSRLVRTLSRVGRKSKSTKQ